MNHLPSYVRFANMSDLGREGVGGADEGLHSESSLMQTKESQERSPMTRTTLLSG